MRAILCLILIWVPALGGCSEAAGPRHEAYSFIVEEEDARGQGGLEGIRTFLDSPDPQVRALAVRALGRLEDPAFLDEIADRGTDTDPGVRSAVALALAQAAFREGGPDALRYLEQAFVGEGEPAVLGALATAIGWVTPASPPDVDAAARAMATISQGLSTPHANLGLIGHTGLARGLEALFRRTQPEGPSAQLLADLAEEAAQTRSTATPLEAARIRGLATAALAQGNRLTAEGLARAAADADAEVRRQAALAVTRYGTDYRALIPRLMADEAPQVRVAGLVAFDRWLRPSQGCGPLLDGLTDPDPHVALGAADLLARPCGELEPQRAALRELVEAAEMDGSPAAQATTDHSDWHLPTRALWALAGMAPEAAREHFAGWLQHPSPFARAWVARAAAQAGSVETLERLAADGDPNVRAAAITGLGPLRGQRSADVYRAQLDADDPQLVATAVSLLPADDAAVLPDVLASLERFTTLRRETTRDVRTALLDFAGKSPSLDPATIEPYLQDFDPEVARVAAGHLQNATGQLLEPNPSPLERTPTPDAQRLVQLGRSNVVLEMEAGGRIVIAIRPDLAATNADRFARLAEEGYFDGLTFHRVVPNFVIQGGSPNANEFAGDGPFSRDEISDASHWRGTVGLSTRGRDTGDAQIFVNLVDNPRLDFNYTIYGEVVEGMDVVDGSLEGAVIRRARVVRRRRP